MLMLVTCSACGGTTPQEDPVAVEPAPAEDPAPAPAPAEDPAPPAQGRVFFVSPADGATVTSPVAVTFGVEGMEVEASGVVNEGKGHHHIIINSGAMDAGVVVPKDETHIHYGAGQTEAELDLEVGEYTLTMQFADGAHASYGPDWSTSIQINVEAGEAAEEAPSGE